MTHSITTKRPAAESGAIKLGDRPVHRLGFGAMRITGEGVWGAPADPDKAKAVLRRAVELGVTCIDTADAYGPDVSEELIADALQPYPDELLIATKGGLRRDGPGQWRPDCRPERLRTACEGSLKRLGVDHIDLYQLHAVDPEVPLAESLGALVELAEAGKIRHIGVSNVDVDQLDEARSITNVVSVQNRYNLSDRSSEPVLERCEAEGIAFIPYFPLAAGDLSKPGGAADEVARAHDASPAQIALAWLLAHSTQMLPIPGTSSVAHLEENLAAAELRLTPGEVASLSAA